MKNRRLQLLSVSTACSLMMIPFAAKAWENHADITRASLQSNENWEAVAYEPIEKVLPSLSVRGQPSPVSLDQFAQRFNIRPEKVNWTWPKADATSVDALEILAYSAAEPDSGMDQNLDLGPDQKYMGDREGLSSQGVRHMFYRGWNPGHPLVTFHIPMREMGLAPERASIYFELARAAKNGGHAFWAYRFLGWGLHYVEDVGQPYHASQFASFKLLPLRVLLTVGWEAFMAETKRIVGNFHLSFERYTEYLCDPAHGAQLPMAFKVPKGDLELKATLEHKSDALNIQEGVRRLAESSQELAHVAAGAQLDFMGKLLLDPSMNLVAGFFAADGKPKVDFAALENDPATVNQRKEVFSVMETALSNTGIAVRWYVDRFRDLAGDSH